MEDESEFVPIYDELHDRNKKRFVVECPICSAKSKKMRQHFLTHLPFQLNSRLRFRFWAIDFQYVVWLLLQLAVIFGLNNVQAMYWFCLDKDILKGVGRHSKFQAEDVAYFDGVSKALQIYPVSYQLHPFITSPALLAHVDVIRALILVKPEVSSLFTSQVQLLSRYSPQNHKSLVFPCFYLDEMKKKSPNLLRFSDFCFGLEFPVSFAVSSLCSGVVPSPQQLKEIHDDDSRLYFCIGFSPRFAHLASGINEKLAAFLDCDFVVGFGVFGLDYILPDCDSKVIRRQIHVLRAGLRFIRDSKSLKPILLTCTDKDIAGDAFYKLFSLCGHYLSKYHPIHFVNFAYPVSFLFHWLNHFPNTSITVSAQHFIHSGNNAIISVVNKVPLHLLLVTSSAPFISEDFASLVETIKKVADRRGMPLFSLLNMLHDNCRRLFNVSL